MRKFLTLGDKVINLDKILYVDTECKAIIFDNNNMLRSGVELQEDTWKLLLRHIKNVKL